jgi:hypothetical protein
MTAQHVIAQGQNEPQPDFRARFDYVVSPLTGKIAEGRAGASSVVATFG